MSSPTEPDRDAVLAAASAIVDAFAATDGETYFGCFSPDASFIFHTEPERLGDRAAYERLWAEWRADGWRVVACTSTDQLVQTFPGGGVFTHSVVTTVQTPDGNESYRERETIIFRADAATDDSQPSLIAVHEHLSSLPEAP